MDSIYFQLQRRQQMHELTSAAASFQTPPSCKTLEIAIDSKSYSSGKRLPNLTSEKNSLCGSLCALLDKSNIRRFSYSGLIDPTLFWPQKTSETDESPPPWNSMQVMEVFFEPGSLAGQWFFKGQPGKYDESSDVPLPQDAEGFLPPGSYDSDEENNAAAAHEYYEYSWPVSSDTIRRIPRDEAILPLLTAVAHRIIHTPSLQTVSLESHIHQITKIWRFRYYAPGETSDQDRLIDREELGCGDSVSRTRVFLYAVEWRPNAEVVTLLRGIGRTCHGKDAIVTFLPYWDWWP